MRGKLVGCGLAVLAALAVGVSGAAGGSLARTTTTTLIVQVIGDGQVTGGGGQIGCGGGLVDCYATYVTGTSVTLAATGGASWSFGTWSGCSSQSGSSCTVSIDGNDHEVVASFTPIGASPGDSTLTVSAPVDALGGGGEITDSADGGAQIDCGSQDDACTWTDFTGSTFTLYETPDNGYQFEGWGGACAGIAPTCTVTMSGDRSVTATFGAVASATTLSVSVSGNGTVSGGGIACTSAGGTGCTATEDANAQVVLTATPAAGSGFSGWGGSCAGTATTCVLTMDGAKQVSASFGGGGGTPATYPVVVSVVGNGTVTGAGIDCGDGATTCAASKTPGAQVVLTAAPAAGSAFSGWGGACSGTRATCTVTVHAATSVTATFTGGSTVGTTRLAVVVDGPGRVTGPGISCGAGAAECSAQATRGRSVTLTATPQAGALLSGWGGACHGTGRVCRVVPSGETAVSAIFRAAGPPSPPAPPAASPLLRSRGRPIVRRSGSGFTVTLRFSVARRGVLRIQALRAGRAEAAFTFAAAAGPASVGPFPLERPGFYRFEIVSGAASLHWTACLGRCGAGAAKVAFAFARRVPELARAGALWSVRLRFRSTVAAGVEVRVYRGGQLTRDVRFPVGAGAGVGRPLLLAPGGYSFRAVAVDAYGRVRSLTWIAVLP